MANKAHVPKFGNWDSGDDVPYTQYFENARKGKTAGKFINPNDPESISQDSPVRRSPGRKYSDAHRLPGSPLRKPPPDSPQHRYVNRAYPSDQNRRGRRTSGGGSDHSFDQSPLHPNNQTKAGSRIGADSPSWERKGASEGHGLAPNTPGRARGRLGGRGGEIPGKGAEVPKFGQWDESDPASADDFTHIFNKVREEKQDGSARVPSPSNQSTFKTAHKSDKNSQSKGCGCFGMFK